MKINVYAVRTKKGISGRELQRRTGISTGTINNIENERTSPTMHKMEKIAKALDTTIEDLYESEYKRKY